MYKKIKNGSFMNWIWFILCLLPFVLLLIYALGFFNNEDLRTNEQDNYKLTLNSINGSTLKEETNVYNTLTQMSYSEIGNFNENGTYTTSVDNKLNPFFEPSNLNSELYLYIFSFNEDSHKQIRIQYQGTTAHYYYFNYANYSQNTNELKLKEIWNTINTNNEPLTNFGIHLTYDNSSILVEDTIFLFFSRTQLFLNYTWFNNWKNYTNNFKTIKYNSCPINYTYNGNTYNIETNSNNYLGTNETLEINQNFNYTLNEEPTLNYNNYFISNIIENSETILGENVGQNIPTTSQYYNQLINCADMEQWEQNYTYYEFNGDDYDLIEIVSNNMFNRIKEDLYIVQTINTTYEYEYYNIESTIETSLTLIPNNNFNDFLTNINNTIQTNGFISNAFLNLAQFFGVNNVYYSLACYYIEYLLVIVLLHLAFDILYIVPNICHKFMEKIGGERD